MAPGKEPEYAIQNVRNRNFEPLFAIVNVRTAGVADNSDHASAANGMFV